MKRSMLLTLLTTGILSTSALAITQKVQLDLSHIHLRGQDSIGLKRIMNNQIGRRSGAGWNLQKVIVSAKSKHGQGEISLKVNQQLSLSKNVPGTPEVFHEPALGFSQITLNSPMTYRGQNQRRIKLVSSGNIKLKKATLKLHKHVQYDSQNLNMRHLVEKVEFKAAKVVGSTKTIRPLSRVKGIVLEGTKRKVRVDHVKIHYRDGQVIIIDELNGKLRDGNQKVFALKGQLAKPIHKITVSATTTSLFGSRGKLAVLLAK